MLGAGVAIFFDDVGMLVICPTAQAGAKEKLPARIQDAIFAGLSANEKLQLKKPAGRRGPRADFSNDGLMPVICPTSQAFYRSLFYLLIIWGVQRAKEHAACKLTD